jgi:hypothetical protein
MKGESKVNPFDFIKSINNKQGYDELTLVIEDGYGSFMTNRYLSFFSDTIFFANEINKYSSVINNRQQFDFYYHLLPSKKNRYSKWIKKDDLENSIKGKADKALFEALCHRYEKPENGGFSRKRILAEVFPLAKAGLTQIEKDRLIKSEVTYGGK